MSNGRRVLAIHAHPDDVEFLCAGTLIRLKERGWHVTIATMTPGDGGSAEHGAAEISAIRRAEAQAAAKLLGADCLCLEFRDLSITHDNDSRRKVCEALRRARPDLVLTSAPIDYMSDHEMTSRLVRDACFSASVPNYSTHQWDPAPILPKMPHLYYMDAIEGIDYYGNVLPYGFIVDISKQFALKQDMLACHASQRNWLLRQHGMDEYLDSCRKWSAKRGATIGAEYGEAFTQHKGHPYPHDDLLQAALA